MFHTHTHKYKYLQVDNDIIIFLLRIALWLKRDERIWRWEFSSEVPLLFLPYIFLIACIKENVDFHYYFDCTCLSFILFKRNYLRLNRTQISSSELWLLTSNWTYFLHNTSIWGSSTPNSYAIIDIFCIRFHCEAAFDFSGKVKVKYGNYNSTLLMNYI